jgi:pilus assembly protein Flp/PilA
MQMEDMLVLLQTLKLVALRRDRRAVTALEYGIIAGVLGLVLITIFKSFGTKMSSLFTSIGNSI